jgi:hypothetical protein
MGPSEISFQTGHDRFANDGITISSTNNQMQRGAPGSAPIVDIGRSLPAPAPSGDEMLNLGKDNETVECVLHSLLYNP